MPEEQSGAEKNHSLVIHGNSRDRGTGFQAKRKQKTQRYFKADRYHPTPEFSPMDDG
jgi:hypothetical protein